MPSVLADLRMPGQELRKIVEERRNGGSSCAHIEESKSGRDNQGTVKADSHLMGHLRIEDLIHAKQLQSSN